MPFCVLLSDLMLSMYILLLYDWTADAIRLDGERNPIGRRTQSDRTANAIRLNILTIYRVKLVFVTKLLLSGNKFKLRKRYFADKNYY